MIAFASYGYAALNTELQLSGEAYVRVPADIRITNVKLSSMTAGGYETYNSKFSKNISQMFVTLPSGGSATYEVEVTNKSTVDYFLKRITNSSDYELVDTRIYDVFPGNSVRKFFVKLTNPESSVKTISLNLDFEFALDQAPTITLADLPKWNTKGDSYAVVPTYSSVSGGNVLCKSNVDSSVAHVTDLSSLTTTGVHDITCTVTSNTGKTASVTKSTKITYDPYNTKNMVVNGSFESGTASWNGLAGGFGVSSSVRKFGANSGYARRVNNTDIHVVQNFDLIKNHHYYAMEWVYLSAAFGGNGQFDLYRSAGTISGYPEYVNLDFAGLQPKTWHKLSGVFVSSVSHNYSFRSAYFLDGTITVYFDGATLIDLTAIFGAGLEPNKEWCDKHIEYFNGTIIIYK